MLCIESIRNVHIEKGWCYSCFRYKARMMHQAEPLDFGTEDFSEREIAGKYCKCEPMLLCMGYFI